jgi:hypothetical protein
MAADVSEQVLRVTMMTERSQPTHLRLCGRNWSDKQNLKRPAVPNQADAGAASRRGGGD